jgi:hypothetical protein
VSFGRTERMNSPQRAHEVRLRGLEGVGWDQDAVHARASSLAHLPRGQRVVILREAPRDPCIAAEPGAREGSCFRYREPSGVPGTSPTRAVEAPFGARSEPGRGFPLSQRRACPLISYRFRLFAVHSEVYCLPHAEGAEDAENRRGAAFFSASSAPPRETPLGLERAPNQRNWYQGGSCRAFWFRADEAPRRLWGFPQSLRRLQPLSASPRRRTPVAPRRRRRVGCEPCHPSA